MPRKQPARKRSTAAEHEKHVEYAVSRLRVRFYRWEIVRDLRRKFDLGERQAERVFAEAQARVREAVEALTGAEQLPAALLFYEHVIRDPDASPATKISAQIRIDRLLGLDKLGTGDRARDELILELLAKLQQPPPEDIENG